MKKMNIKRFLKEFVTDPNSSEGLRLRADHMKELGDKEPNLKQKEKNYLYAEVLIALAQKEYPSWKNKQLIKENLHTKSMCGEDKK